MQHVISVILQLWWPILLAEKWWEKIWRQYVLYRWKWWLVFPYVCSGMKAYKKQLPLYLLSSSISQPLNVYTWVVCVWMDKTKGSAMYPHFSTSFYFSFHCVGKFCLQTSGMLADGPIMVNPVSMRFAYSRKELERVQQLKECFLILSRRPQKFVLFLLH